MGETPTKSDCHENDSENSVWKEISCEKFLSSCHMEGFVLPAKEEANVPDINTIPGEDVFYLDCRLLPHYKVEDLLKEVRKICDEVEQDFRVTIEFDTPQLRQAPPATPADAEIIRKLKMAIKEVYQVEAKPMGIGGGTVAAFFRENRLPVAVWSKIDDVCHQPNEYAVISNMVNDAKVFAHVCLQE